jgi:hypothetical protein
MVPSSRNRIHISINYGVDVSCKCIKRNCERKYFNLSEINTMRNFHDIYRSPSIVKIVKSRWMHWIDKRNKKYKHKLARENFWKGTVWKIELGWIIITMYLKETGYGNMN